MGELNELYRQEIVYNHQITVIKDWMVGAPLLAQQQLTQNKQYFEERVYDTEQRIHAVQAANLWHVLVAKVHIFFFG